MFTKLLTFMQARKACPESFAAVRAAKSWDELRSHPQAGGWADWALGQTAEQAREQAGQAYEQAYGQAYEQARQAYEQAGQAYEQARQAYRQAYGQARQAYEQARQAYEQARQAYEQACIRLVREIFETKEASYKKAG